MKFGQEKGGMNPINIVVMVQDKAQHCFLKGQHIGCSIGSEYTCISSTKHFLKIHDNEPLRSRSDRHVHLTIVHFSTLK